MRQFVLFVTIFLVNLTWTVKALPLKNFPSQFDAVETFELDKNNLPLIPFQEISLQTTGRLQVANTEDIIKLLLPHSTDPVVESLLKILELPEVRFLVDRVLLQYPELPRILKSLGDFLKGEEAKPLIDAFRESQGPVLKTLLDLYEKIKDPVEKAIEELMVEGIRLFFRLQTPQVAEVLKKLQSLPEVHELAGYLVVYNIDLVRALQRLESLLNGGALRL